MIVLLKRVVEGDSERRFRKEFNDRTSITGTLVARHLDGSSTRSSRRAPCLGTGKGRRRALVRGADRCTIECATGRHPFHCVSLVASRAQRRSVTHICRRQTAPACATGCSRIGTRRDGYCAGSCFQNSREPSAQPQRESARSPGSHWMKRDGWDEKSYQRPWAACWFISPSIPSGTLDRP